MPARSNPYSDAVDVRIHFQTALKRYAAFFLLRIGAAVSSVERAAIYPAEGF
jgi:hypothetical protein